MFLASLVHTLSGPFSLLRIWRDLGSSFDDQTIQILSSLCVLLFLFPLPSLLTPFSLSLGNLLGSSLSFFGRPFWWFLFLAAGFSDACIVGLELDYGRGELDWACFSRRSEPGYREEEAEKKF